MPQTTIAQEITARYAGRISTTLDTKIQSRRLLAATEFGLLLLRSPADAVGTTRQPADTSAADVDAILATGASAAGAGRFDADDFDGVIGPSMIRPTRHVTFVFSNHADWDLTVARFWGIDETGALVSEEIHIPNAGNITRTTTRRYRKAVSLDIPAQSGAGGTFTIGIAAGGAVADFVASTTAVMSSTQASAAVGQLFGGAQFDGTLGLVTTFPAKRVTVTFNNHGDWDATNAVIEGEDERGAPVSDTIAIPNGGNATVTGVRQFSRVTSIWIPAQTGTNGTFTIGYAGNTIDVPQWGTLFEHDGVAVYDPAIEQAATPAGYPINYMASCLIEGEIDMTSEVATIEGAQVYVRLISAGAEVRGQVRMDDDGGDAVPVAGMFFGEARAAGDVKVRVRPAV